MISAPCSIILMSGVWFVISSVSSNEIVVTSFLVSFTWFSLGFYRFVCNLYQKISLFFFGDVRGFSAFGCVYLLGNGDIHHSWIVGWCGHRLSFLVQNLITYVVAVLTNVGMFFYLNLYVGYTLILFLVLSSISALTKILALTY